MSRLTGEANNGARRVAVLADGSTLPEADVAVALREQAELISSLARIPARPMVVDAADAVQLAARVRGLPADVGAVLLTHHEPTRAWAAQREVRASAGRVVLADQDTAAIALSAAFMTALAEEGRQPRGSRVVITDAHRLPILSPLLIATGVTDITIWNRSDAAVLPLHQVVFGADVVLDLASALPASVTDRPPGLLVLTSDDAQSAPIATAGLLRAVLHSPGSNVDIDVCHACARALLAAAPAGRAPSPGQALTLTDAVAKAATDVFRARQIAG